MSSRTRRVLLRARCCINGQSTLRQDSTATEYLDGKRQSISCCTKFLESHYSAHKFFLREFLFMHITRIIDSAISKVASGSSIKAKTTRPGQNHWMTVRLLLHICAYTSLHFLGGIEFLMHIYIRPKSSVYALSRSLNEL